MRRLTRLLRTSTLLLTVAGCTANPATDAAVQVTLPPADAVLSHDFTTILSVRELPSGEALITDPKDNRIYLADFDADSVRLVAAIGDGPKEYRQAGRLFAISADSTIMTDLRSRRWLTFAGSEVGTVIPTDHPAVEAASRGYVLGMDTLGFLVASVESPNATRLGDSLLIVRINRATGATELLRKSPSGSESGVVSSAAASGGGVPKAPSYMMSLVTFDQAAVFADGLTGIVRATPYHVAWCAVEAPCREGDRIGERAPPVTLEDKVEFLMTAAATATWPPTINPDETIGWPEFVPPFAYPASLIEGTAVFPSPDGRVVVRRVASTQAPANRYDIIGRTGAREGWLQLPRNHQIVQFGARHLYVSVTDEMGNQHLQRHRWP
jgi:hypothetical protein